MRKNDSDEIARLRAENESLYKRNTELEAKLARLRKPGFVQHRIAKAYPKLSEGRNFGVHFRRIRENEKDGMKK